MWCKKSLAVAAAESSPSPAAQGTKRTSLVSLSTQTNTALQPLSKGRPVTKSMVQQENRSGGIGRGAKAPGGA